MRACECVRARVCTRAVRNTRVTAEPERICFSAATDGRLEEGRRRREHLCRFLPLPSRLLPSRPVSSRLVLVPIQKLLSRPNAKWRPMKPRCAGLILAPVWAVKWRAGQTDDSRDCNLFHGFVYIKMDGSFTWFTSCWSDCCCQAAWVFLLASLPCRFSVVFFLFAVIVNVSFSSDLKSAATVNTSSRLISLQLFVRRMCKTARTGKNTLHGQVFKISFWDLRWNFIKQSKSRQNLVTEVHVNKVENSK